MSKSSVLAFMLSILFGAKTMIRIAEAQSKTPTPTPTGISNKINWPAFII